MILNEDYKDIVQALNDEQVEFILIGAYALAAHGYPRATMDIDLWVRPSPKNAQAVLRAIKRFGATELDFKTARTNAIIRNIDETQLKILSIEDLIKNKESTGRPKDQLDTRELKRRNET